MDEKGVWRTVGGRRIFIKEGQSLTEAMKSSNKFDKDNKFDNLSKEEKEILYNYTRGFYNATQEDLKTKGYNELPNEFKKKVDKLDEILSKDIIEEGVYYRTENIENLGLNYNNYFDENSKNKMLEDFKENIGKTYYDNGFKSVASDEKQAIDYRSYYSHSDKKKYLYNDYVLIEYQIEGKINGISINENSYVKEQTETLLSRHTKTTITDVTYNEEHKGIVLKAKVEQMSDKEIKLLGEVKYKEQIYKTNETIKHDVFGKGKIVYVSGNIIKIDFGDNIGTKLISKHYFENIKK